MVHAVFLPFLLERSNFSVWKKGTCTTAHHRRYAKVFKNTRIDKGKKRAFRELCLIFREQKTILKASLQYGFAANMMYIKKLFIKFRGGCQHCSRMTGAYVFHQPL